MVSGLQVLFHLRAALVYAASFERHSITCIACRSSPRRFAKTCNHCSGEHPASGTGHVRIHRHWPFGRCFECLLHNDSATFALTGRIATSWTMCQKAFQRRASISRPRTARVSRSSRAVAVFAVARVDVSRQLNGRPTRRGREGSTQGPYGRRCPFDCTGAGRIRPTVVSDRDTGRMVASRRARQHVFDITPRFDRQTAPAMPCLGIASPISIFRLL